MAHGNRSLLLERFGIKRLLHQGILHAGGVRIVSYPRSGRTWLRLMLHDVGADPKFTHAGSKNSLQCTPAEICLGMEKYHRRRIVFLHRNPYDVVVSHFHHCRHRGVWEGDLSTFIRDPRNGLERVLAFNLGWLEASGDFANFIAVSYEDLRADPRPGLTRMLGFMRCHLVRDSDIEHAIANNTFDNMKRRERSGELHARFGDRFTPGGSADNDMVVRRGHIGGHKEELGAEDCEFCDQLVARYDYFARLNGLTAKAE